jgi:hypothetical protein
MALPSVPSSGAIPQPSWTLSRNLWLVNWPEIGNKETNMRQTLFLILAGMVMAQKSEGLPNIFNQILIAAGYIGK